MAGLSAVFLQLLGGLSYATTLFLMAAGLTLIFGVTRIVNFAHGSFFMLGALFTAHWVTDWFPAWGESAPLYLLAIILGAVCAGLAGAIAEFFLLRRLAGVPELYQLVATFGLTLAMHDAMQWGFGPDEVFAPRFPGLKGSLQIGEDFFPVYQLVMIALGPLVWLGLHLLLKRSLFGRRLRAATHDRSMLAALGVNPKPLMLGAVVLGCALAGLGGALQLPREPAHLQMDMNVIVETFVVVVMGGLGSIGGAFVAALLIGMVHAFGISVFPQATLVLVFLTMAVVLVFRPQGLFGVASAAVDAPREPAQKFNGLQPGLVPTLLVLAVFAVFVQLPTQMTALDSLSLERSYSVGDVQVHLVVMLTLFVLAFFAFTLSLRQFNHFCIMLGALEHTEETPPEEIDAIAQMNAMGAKNFNTGIRAYYFSVSTVAWFVSEWLAIGVCLATILVLAHREFFSTAHRTAALAAVIAARRQDAKK